MRYCINCGKEVAENVLLCYECSIMGMNSNSKANEKIEETEIIQNNNVTSEMIESELIDESSAMNNEIQPIVVESITGDEDKTIITKNFIDKPSGGLNFLSFLYPIVGFIIYLDVRKNKPVEAHHVGKWAWIGLAVRVVLILLYFSLLIWIFVNGLEEAYDGFNLPEIYV